MITCGPGRDRAWLDTVDVIADATPANPQGSCEIVRRSEPRQGADRTEEAESAPTAERDEG